jgi:hypothetical protein
MEDSSSLARLGLGMAPVNTDKDLFKFLSPYFREQAEVQLMNR